MKRLPHPIRAALAVAAGLLLAGTLAAPASAAYAQDTRSAFEIHDTGEDLCTFFHSEGEVEWVPVQVPELPPAVLITGTAWITHAPPDTTCLSVVPEPRSVEFTAYVKDRAVAEYAVPFEADDNGGGFPGEVQYDFPLFPPSDELIDRLTVAICKVGFTDGSSQQDRCTEAVVLTRSDAA